MSSGPNGSASRPMAYHFGEGKAGDGALQVTDAQDVKRVEADRVPHADVRLIRSHCRHSLLKTTVSRIISTKSQVAVSSMGPCRNVSHRTPYTIVSTLIVPKLYFLREENKKKREILSKMKGDTVQLTSSPGYMT